MFSRIVVGIDGTDGGRDALALAKQLADDQTEIFVVSVFPHKRTPSRGSVGGYEKILREESEKLLAQVIAGDDRCRPRAIADASPSRALHEIAAVEQADLIVVGSCHRGVVGRVLLGDASRGTLHGAPCAVAIAPRNHSFGSPGRPLSTIGVAFDGSPESEEAVNFAESLAREVGAGLKLMTVAEGPAAFAPQYAYAYDWTEIAGANRKLAQERIADLAADIDVPVQTKVVEGLPGSALERFSEETDLLIAGSRGRGAFRQAILGSTTSRLAHHSACPLIVVAGLAADRGAGRHTGAAHA